MRVIFMGSPAFALPTLKAIFSSDHEIIAVYTQPPRMSGRGYKENRTIIHQQALEFGLKVYCPENFKNQHDIEQFESLNADIAIVVAYGLIIPQNLLTKTKYGFINLHPSDLPKFRGAAPIQRTILSGDDQTAICIIKMDAGIDTGDILQKQYIKIDNKTNFSQLHDITSNIGANLIVDTIDNFNSISSSKQENIGASYASKIQKSEGLINFKIDNLITIDRKIRALNPAPGTYVKLKDKIVKIKEAEPEYCNHEFETGTVIDDNFTIACIGGFLRPKIVQIEGKKEMQIDEFLRGFMVPKGSEL